MNELKSRGVQDIFIACCDGLKGFPEAIETVFPKTKVQLCIVHQVRNSLKYVSHKQRKEIATDLKTIYGADTLAEAEDNLLAFAEKWDGEHPQISKAWQENWGRLTTFFDYPKDIRRVIYTTNTIESLNASLRKVTSTKKTFPNDDAVFKAIYMALINTMQRWTMPIQNWKPAMRQFVMLVGLGWRVINTRYLLVIDYAAILGCLYRFTQKNLQSLAAAKACFENWLSNYGSTGNHEQRQIIKQVQAFIHANGKSRFSEWKYDGHNSTLPNRVGFYRADDDSYYIYASLFEKEVCLPFNKKQVAETLDSLNLLNKNKGYQLNVNSSDRDKKGYFYCIKGAILELEH